MDGWIPGGLMMNKKFRVDDLVKYDYSAIGEYVDENHTDRPLRNDEVCDLLNEQQGIIEEKNNVITLMGAFIKNNGFSIDDFNEWISKDWYK